LYKQGTVKDVTDFDRTNDTMLEYASFMLGPVTSKAVSILTRYIDMIEEKLKRKCQLLMAASADVGLSTATEVTHRYSMDNSKHYLVVDTED
jgi:hypothetical protein